MFNLVKNYKKIFLMFIRNNFEGEAGAYEMKQKVNELKELGENGIEENKEELKDVKKILQEILDYSKTSNKIAKEQLEEIINFLENQINNLVHKEQTSQVLMNDSFSEYNKQSLDFFYSSKSEFEALRKKYFSEKKEVTQNTKQETEELYPEIEAEKEEAKKLANYGFIINENGSVILPDGFDMTDEDDIFINTNTQEKYKLENGKIVKISGGKENNKETITPPEKDEVKVEEKSGEKTQESKEKIDYSLEEAKKFYEKVGATEDNIKAIQGALGFSGKDLDGKFGPKTFKAIIEFQKENGLNLIDGKVGTETLGTMKLIKSNETYKDFYKKNIATENTESEKGENKLREEDNEYREKIIEEYNINKIDLNRILYNLNIEPKKLYDFIQNFDDNVKNSAIQILSNVLDPRKKLDFNKKENIKNLILNFKNGVSFQKYIKDLSSILN